MHSTEGRKTHENTQTPDITSRQIRNRLEVISSDVAMDKSGAGWDRGEKSFRAEADLRHLAVMAPIDRNAQQLTKTHKVQRSVKLRNHSLVSRSASGWAVI